MDAPGCAGTTRPDKLAPSKRQQTAAWGTVIHHCECLLRVILEGAGTHRVLDHVAALWPCNQHDRIDEAKGILPRLWDLHAVVRGRGA